MASSRLEKIGTIFSRVTGLLRSGAMKEVDKPLWYNLYKAFPPTYEPRFDRPAPNIPIRNILYPEDEIRVKFHKTQKNLKAVNLADHVSQTTTQRFISVYNRLKEEGKIPEENLFEESLAVFQTESQTFVRSRVSTVSQEKLTEVTQEHDKTDVQGKLSVDIKDIFK
ncbi:small ribosomal subunit protein mS23 isoform X1 [Bacillus rossius redtenbacheri]|uniref:small ribosomal subunit protein mS23 isoform X1 n=1 Tax=Bacillus rossius redtenbacheri TaxID=93214 RepID=UPI002FDD1D4D